MAPNQPQDAGIFSHSGNPWSLDVVHALGVSSPFRHAELRRRLHGVTQRMLTHTLRQLERDGVISRRDFGEKLLRVEYALTELGMGLLVQMISLWTWVVEQSEVVIRPTSAMTSVKAGLMHCILCST